MPSDLDILLEALADAPGGLTRPELLRRLRERIPYIGARDVERVLQSAGATIRIEENRIYATPPAARPVETEQCLLPRRLVVFDLESIVRPVVRDPYREQHVFQIGAVRFGLDEAWVAEEPQFTALTALPNEDDEFLIYRDELRARYQAEKRPLADVLEEFRTFCKEAYAVVAYNGAAHDFRLIDEEYKRCELPALLEGTNAPHLVDALYLAQALWPIPPRQHRLRELLERLEIDVEEMCWHDALDDSKMVVELLEFGAREFLPLLGDELVALLAAAGSGSDAWELLFALTGGAAEPRPYDHAGVCRVLLAALEAKASKEPLRPEPPQEPDDGEQRAERPAPEPQRVTIPKGLRGGDGRVSLDKLVASVKGEGAEARESQRLMVAQIREWLEQGVPALVEAPTGTGKSYAILAAALD